MDIQIFHLHCDKDEVPTTCSSLDVTLLTVIHDLCTCF